MPDFSRIVVTPTRGALGAELSGLDLGDHLDDATVAEIRRAFLEHHVVFFRDQTLGPTQLAALGARFGELEDYPFVEPLPEHPKIIAVIKEKDETVNFGGGWHTDMIYRPEPALGTMLYALEVPDRGGDTMFADGVLAYRALSERMQTWLADLRVVYSVDNATRAIRERTGGQDEAGRSMAERTDEEVFDTTPVHPLVRTHPETGEKCLYFSRAHTVNFEGMTVAESQPMLDWLQRHMTQPVFTTRFHWRPGSLAFWDNRCVSHYALNDYDGERRHMHRLTIAGDAPA